MSETNDLRAELTKRGVEWMPCAWEPQTETFYKNGDGVAFIATESTAQDGFLLRTDMAVTSEQAIAATLGNDDAYTREDVESAFVSGYSLGTLPVGSDPQWDENKQTVDEHMAELGWFRAAMLETETCKLEEIDKGCDTASEYMINREWCFDAVYRCSCGCRFGHAAHDRPRYCPNCGAKVVDE